MNTAPTADFHTNQHRAAVIDDLAHATAGTPVEDIETLENAQETWDPSCFVPSMHFLRGVIHAEH